MHTSYTVGLTTAQYMAFSNVCADIQTWFETCIHTRAGKAMDDICSKYTTYKLDNEEPITAVGRDAMVIAAFDEGIVAAMEAMPVGIGTSI